MLALGLLQLIIHIFIQLIEHFGILDLGYQLFPDPMTQLVINNSLTDLSDIELTVFINTIYFWLEDMFPIAGSPIGFTTKQHFELLQQQPVQFTHLTTHFTFDHTLQVIFKLFHTLMSFLFSFFSFFSFSFSLFLFFLFS